MKRDWEGRAEMLRVLQSQVWGSALVSFGIEEAKGYLITAATAQKALTDMNKTPLWRDSCYNKEQYAVCNSRN